MRSPPSPRIVKVASSATRSGGRWFVGSATHTFPPTVPRFRTCTSAIVAATSPRIGRATSTSEEATSCAYVTIAPISSRPSDEKPIVRSSSRSARSTSTSGAAARAFITFTIVCPPARALAPACRREKRDRLLHGRRARVSDLTQEHAGDSTQRRCRMSSDSRLIAVARRWRPSTQSSSAPESTPSRARRCSPRPAGTSACSSARRRSAAASGPSTDLTAPGFTHEVLASWHPLWTGSPAYAELKDDLDRRGVEYLNTELPTASTFPDGSTALLSTSLEENVAELERHAAGRRRGLGGHVRELHEGRRPVVRRPRDRALVAGRPRPRPAGASPLRPPRPARLRGDRPHDGAATGSATRSSRTRRTGCSRPGCCTRGSAPTRRRPAS